MATSHFITGIDFVTDSTGQTPLANYYFISKSGSDGSGDGLPTNPYLTIQGAMTAGGTSKNYVVGSGEYAAEDLSGADKKSIYGDGIVYLRGNSTNALATGILYFNNLIIEDYAFLRNSTQGGHRFLNCFIKNCTTVQTGGTVDRLQIQNSLVINCSIEASWTGAGGPQLINETAFINSTFINTDANTLITNSYFDSNSTLTCDNTTSTYEFEYNNMEGTQTNAPTSEIGTISADPLFNGSPSDYETSIESTSPLVGAGANGRTIGGVVIGVLQNGDSTEFGISPSSNVNTQYNGDVLELVSAASDGTRESQIIDLGRVYNSPTMKMAGETDFLNNVFAFDQLSNPNFLSLEVRYAGVDQSFNTYKSFRMDNPVYLDGTGKSSGETGFDWGDTVDQTMRYIQFRVTVASTYTPS